MDFPVFNSILILLLVAVTVSAVLIRLRLPAIFAYLVVGILVGPHGLAWIPDSKATHEVAEFGIVFLMFTIGLEFSFTRLMSMKKIVFGYGGLQVLLSIIATVLIGFLLGMNAIHSLIIGCIVAMSSTAVVTKQLTDQSELHSRHGHRALGILLFQDVAVIPILILIPSLAQISQASVGLEIVEAIVKGAIAIFIILTIGRWVLKPMFYTIAESRSVELFTLTALLVTLGSAWITHSLGMSLALGAFLAGMMLSESEFKHQVEVDIRPFRDVLLGLFFISIGMQLDLHIIIADWHWMILLLAALLVFKTALITGLSHLFGDDKSVALRVGLILAHGGEFGFALLTLALTYKIIPYDYGQVILGAILFSMAIATLLLRHNRAIAQYLFPESLKQSYQEIEKEVASISNHLQEHVIICGYGRVGQNIARILGQVDVPTIALDLDPERVKNAQVAGDCVCYADASHVEVLNAAGLKQAKAVLISFYGVHSILRAIQQVRKLNKSIPIIVHSYDDADSEAFLSAGATEVIPETLESSLLLASHLLLSLNYPSDKVHDLIHKVRARQYDILHMVFPGEESMRFVAAADEKEGLYSVRLGRDAYAIGKPLSEFDLRPFHVSVVAIRDGKIRIHDPKPTKVLKSGQVLVLFGPLPQLESAEKYLLDGIL